MARLQVEFEAMLSHPFRAWSDYPLMDKVLPNRLNAGLPIPLVSVLIPAYNPRYFATALESALAQSYENIEIVICDDCPTDEIQKIIALYHEPRIRYYKNEKNLCRDNYPRCFSYAKGTFVKFLNDDDILNPECISRLIHIFQRNPSVKLATSRRQPIDAEGNALKDTFFTAPPLDRTSIVDGRSAIRYILGSRNNFIGEPSNVLFRRSDADAVPDLMSLGGDKISWNVDIALYVNLLLKGPLVYIAEPLSYFRIHAQQQQRSKDDTIHSPQASRQIETFCRSVGVTPNPESVLLYRPLDDADETSDWLSIRLPNHISLVGAEVVQDGSWTNVRPILDSRKNQTIAFNLLAGESSHIRLILGPFGGFWSFAGIRIASDFSPSNARTVLKDWTHNNYDEISLSPQIVRLSTSGALTIFAPSLSAPHLLLTLPDDIRPGQRLILELDLEFSYELPQFARFDVLHESILQLLRVVGEYHNSSVAKDTMLGIFNDKIGEYHLAVMSLRESLKNENEIHVRQKKIAGEDLQRAKSDLTAQTERLENLCVELDRDSKMSAALAAQVQALLEELAKIQQERDEIQTELTLANSRADRQRSQMSSDSEEIKTLRPLKQSLAEREHELTTLRTEYMKLVSGVSFRIGRVLTAPGRWLAHKS